MTIIENIMFTLYLWDQTGEDEFTHELGAFAIHFKSYILPSLDKGHFGHCTNIEHKCDRCYAEQLKSAAEKLHDTFTAATIINSHIQGIARGY